MTRRGLRPIPETDGGSRWHQTDGRPQDIWPGSSTDAGVAGGGLSSHRLNSGTSISWLDTNCLISQIISPRQTQLQRGCMTGARGAAVIKGPEAARWMPHLPNPSPHSHLLTQGPAGGQLPSRGVWTAWGFLLFEQHEQHREVCCNVSIAPSSQVVSVSQGPSQSTLCPFSFWANQWQWAGHVKHAS